MRTTTEITTVFDNTLERAFKLILVPGFGVQDTSATKAREQANRWAIKIR